MIFVGVFHWALDNAIKPFFYTARVVSFLARSVRCHCLVRELGGIANGAEPDRHDDDDSGGLSWGGVLLRIGEKSGAMQSIPHVPVFDHGKPIDSLFPIQPPQPPQSSGSAVAGVFWFVAGLPAEHASSDDHGGGEHGENIADAFGRHAGSGKGSGGGSGEGSGRGNGKGSGGSEREKTRGGSG